MHSFTLCGAPTLVSILNLISKFEQFSMTCSHSHRTPILALIMA